MCNSIFYGLRERLDHYLVSRYSCICRDERLFEVCLHRSQPYTDHTPGWNNIKMYIMIFCNKIIFQRKLEGGVREWSYRVVTNGPSLTLLIILLTEDMAFGLKDINC